MPAAERSDVSRRPDFPLAKIPAFWPYFRGHARILEEWAAPPRRRERPARAARAHPSKRLPTHADGRPRGPTRQAEAAERCSGESGSRTSPGPDEPVGHRVLPTSTKQASILEITRVSSGGQISRVVFHRRSSGWVSPPRHPPDNPPTTTKLPFSVRRRHDSGEPSAPQRDRIRARAPSRAPIEERATQEVAGAKARSS